MVHDFTASAIALKIHFGDELKIGRALDTQFALEALQGDIRGTVGSVIEAFTGEHDLFSDAAYRCRFLVCIIPLCPIIKAAFDFSINVQMIVEVRIIYRANKKLRISYIFPTRAFDRPCQIQQPCLGRSGTRGASVLVFALYGFWTSFTSPAGDSEST